MSVPHRILIVFGLHIVINSVGTTFGLRDHSQGTHTGWNSPVDSPDYFATHTTDEDDNYDYYDTSNETVNLHRVQWVDRFEKDFAERVNPKDIEDFLNYANRLSKTDPRAPIPTFRPATPLTRDCDGDENSDHALGAFSHTCPPGCIKTFGGTCIPKNGVTRTKCSSGNSSSRGRQLTFFSIFLHTASSLGLNDRLIHFY